MSALGVVLVGFGVLTCWAALDKQNVFDILRAILGEQVPQRVVSKAPPQQTPGAIVPGGDTGGTAKPKTTTA